MPKLWFTLLLLTTLNIHASICSHLSGTWLGTWASSATKSVQAQLEISVSKIEELTGVYKMNREEGAFSGTCSTINSSEAYLILTPDPPLYNPCRGALLQKKASEWSLHIFCFNPNEQGYFTKDDL